MRKTKRGEARAFFEAALEAAHNDCILWPYKVSDRGYPRIYIDGKHVPVGNAVCRRFRGSPPSEKHEGAHSCGNRLCINPNHIRWATHLENEADKIGHGTIARGEKLPQSKISQRDVSAIRKRLDTGEPQAAIARDFGVHQQTISALKCGLNWSWVS